MSTSATSTARDPNARTFNDSTIDSVRDVSELAGRSLLSGLFLISGLFKIVGYAQTVAYMSSLGVPAALLPLVIATEVLGAIAVIIGWQTRITAFLLAGYSLLTALIFHSNLADQIQMIMFLKNIAIAGGFLLLVAKGAGPLSLDYRFGRRGAAA